MSLVEGGSFKCYTHGFETTQIAKWNEHCTEEGHTDNGETSCVTCGERIRFSELPFHPLAADGSKNISLRCETCEQKMLGKVKRSKGSK